MSSEKKRADRWALLAAGLIALPLAAVAPTAPIVTTATTATGATQPSGRWAGWLGSTAGDTPATLQQVRNYIGADSGVAGHLTGKGVGVALIDTGVAPVPGLPASQIVNGPDLSFESQAPNLRYLDTFGHGTHMAGIIVADDSATGTRGLAPRAKLTSIKVGTANGAVDVTQVIAAVDWVVAHRNDDPANPIRVINLSYGSGGTPKSWDDSLSHAVEKAWSSGIVVVAAAGNDGNDTVVLANPATDLFVIGVGATRTKGTATTADDEVTTFTNLAKMYKQVDVLAPGTSIVSLRDNGSSVDSSFPNARYGNTLFRGTGTSQAAAVTSAAVALILQARPQATPDQIKSWLVNSATYLPTGKAAGMGLKQINVNAALGISSARVRPQTWYASTGNGTLDAARGSSRVVYGKVPLAGAASVWGPLSTSDWAERANKVTTWSGGTWMGYRVAGDGWTGNSWASRTWAPATWTSKPWNGAASWSDPNWAGRTWAGRTWSGGTWSARTWSSDDWSASAWQ